MPDIQAHIRPHILVVDDDADLRKLTAAHLNRSNYEVTTAKDVPTALNEMQQQDFDLIVLDIMMPGKTGLELAQNLREDEHATYDIPIIMLTAMGSNDQRVKGLESGADDYLTKPFDPRELTLRIQKLLRRAAPKPTEAGDKAAILFGPFSYNTNTQRLTKHASPIDLSSTEQELIHLLIQRINIPVSREMLAQNLNNISERSIDVQINRLRKKIEDDPKHPLYLQAVWGKGYVLRDV